MMEGLTFSKLFKGGAIAFFLLTIISGIFLGILPLIKEGNIKPLADNTFGLLMASDNQAFNLEKKWEDGEFDTIDESYQIIVKEAVLNTIITNIIISFIVLFGLYKLMQKIFDWNEPQGTKFSLLAMVSAVLVYSVLGIIYFVFTIIYTKTSLSGNYLDLILSAVPLKSVVYGAKMLIMGV